MTALLVLSLAAAVVDWLAVGAGRREVERVSKPAALLLLLLWFVLSLEGSAGGLGLGLAVGLVFSLLGDVFLLLPERWFIFGLAAFLLAQVSYAVALNAEGPVLTGRSAAISVAVAGLSLVMFLRLRLGLRASGKLRMLTPVAAYLVAISVMLWSAACAPLRLGWPAPGAALLAVGGALFYASDGILAWNRFVTPFRQARLLTRITYHLGQFGLAVGAVLVTRAV